MNKPFGPWFYVELDAVPAVRRLARRATGPVFEARGDQFVEIPNDGAELVVEFRGRELRHATSMRELGRFWRIVRDADGRELLASPEESAAADRLPEDHRQHAF